MNNHKDKPSRELREDHAKYLTGRPYQLFKRGIKSPRTVVFYNRCLYFFCVFVGMTTDEMAEKFAPYIKVKGKNTPNIDGQIELQRLVENYVLALQERVDKEEIKPSSAVSRMSPVRLFFDMNDIILNWTKIGKLLPRGESAADDEAYTRPQIQKMLEHCDLRSKTVILFLASSGMRLGALADTEEPENHLRDGAITPMYDPSDPGKLLCAHVVAYKGTDAEYDTFVSPEAYYSYAEYKKLRAKYGEVITPDSPAFVIRFDDKTYSNKSSSKAMDYHSIQKLINKIRKKAGVAIPSKSYKNRCTIKVVHGFRKFFLSSLKSIKTSDGRFAIDFTERERLMGHSLMNERSLEENYDKRERVKILMADYLLAVHELTISEEARQALEIKKLEKTVSEYETIEVEMSQKDKEIRDLRAKMEAMQEDHNVIKDLIKHPQKLADMLKENESA